jgi:hypothetical protein
MRLAPQGILPRNACPLPHDIKAPAVRMIRDVPVPAHHNDIMRAAPPRAALQNVNPVVATLCPCRSVFALTFPPQPLFFTQVMADGITGLL